MSLTVTANWKAAMYRSGVEMRFFVEIDDGTTQWTAIDGPSTQLAYQPAVVAVNPVSARYDPFDKKVQISRVSVSFLDEWLRPILAANRLKGMLITIKIGTRELAEVDYAAYFAGFIDDDLPDESQEVITVEALDTWSILGDQEITGAWMGLHPLEIVEDILDTKMGLDAAYYNASLLDPSNAANAANSHLVANAYRPPLYAGEEIDTTIYKPTTAKQLIDGLMEMVEGALVPQEDGSLEPIIFDSTAAAVQNWDSEEIISLRQISNWSRTHNRVTAQCGGPMLSKTNVYGDVTTSQFVLAINDDDSQTNHAHGINVKRVYSRDINNPWTKMGLGRIYDVSGVNNDHAASFDASLAGAFCGTRDWVNNPADSRPSSSRPLYWLLVSQDGLKQEIVKVEARPVASTGFISFGGTFYYWDPGPPPVAKIGNGLPVLTVTLAGRAMFGAGSVSSLTIASISDAGGSEINVETSAAHGLATGDGVYIVAGDYTGDYSVTYVDATNFEVTVSGGYDGDAAGTVYKAETFSQNDIVVDITPQVYMADNRVNRYGAAAPEIEVITNMLTYEAQIGELVSVTWPAFIAYGADGIDTSTKWEITSKEIRPYGPEPVIAWRLVRATEGTSTKLHNVWSNDLQTRRDKAIQRVLNQAEAVQTRGEIQAGLDVTDDGGTDITIAAGVIRTIDDRIDTAETSLTLNASKDTYLFVDLYEGEIHAREVANSATPPDQIAHHILFAKVVTDAVPDITSIVDLVSNADGMLGASTFTSEFSEQQSECPNATFGDW